MMHAVATSPDDLFLELPLGTLFEKRPERPSQRKEKKWLHRSSFLSKARRYPDSIRKNSPNSTISPNSRSTC